MPPPNKPKEVVMLVGHYDPPTLDYTRAIDGLRDNGFEEVFLCPISSGNKKHDIHIKAMSSIMACEKSSGITLCTVGLDKGLDGSNMRLWLEKKYTDRRFRVAYLSSDPQAEGIPIVIGNIAKNTLFEPIYIPKHLSCQEGASARIALGRDESRSFSALIWNYIRRHSLYIPIPKESENASATEIH